jgi:hypothetical protein
MGGDKAQKGFPWGSAIIAVTILVIALLAYQAYVKTGRAVREEAGKAIELGKKLVSNVPEIARNFKTGNITQTFRESITQVHSTGGDILELATIQSDELFERSDERRIGWDLVYLGTTVVEIRVPVTFRYHLRLSDPWRLASRGQVCLVLAPRIRATLPPAIHTGSMEKRAESGWARFDKNEKLDELERSITDILERRAMDSSHLKVAREACRQSVAEFVKKWLMREDQWKSDRFTAIIVVFPDEAQFASDRELLSSSNEPTIKLERN